MNKYSYLFNNYFLFIFIMISNFLIILSVIVKIVCIFPLVKVIIKFILYDKLYIIILDLLHKSIITI